MDLLSHLDRSNRDGNLWPLSLLLSLLLM
jgi:hypothetical protein